MQQSGILTSAEIGAKDSVQDYVHSMGGMEAEQDSFRFGKKTLQTGKSKHPKQEFIETHLDELEAGTFGLDTGGTQKVEKMKRSVASKKKGPDVDPYGLQSTDFDKMNLDEDDTFEQRARTGHEHPAQGPDEDTHENRLKKARQDLKEKKKSKQLRPHCMRRWQKQPAKT